MQFNNRLEYLDHCVAGDITSFNTLLSRNVFNTFDQSYNVYRDYIKHKQSVEQIRCRIHADDLIVELKSKESLSDLISENIPKKILPTESSDGVELHMKLIDIADVDYKGVENV